MVPVGLLGLVDARIKGLVQALCVAGLSIDKLRSRMSNHAQTHVFHGSQESRPKGLGRL